MEKATYEKNKIERAAVQNLQIGLAAWVEFSKDARVLYVGEKEDGIAVMLREKNVDLVVCDFSEIPSKSDFDYVICVKKLETAKCPETELKKLHRCCKEDGTMLLGMNNRLGIRYFCGDRDPYTQKVFDGVENYVSETKSEKAMQAGRMYAKSEITKMLQATGWLYQKFYSVFPDLEHPFRIYAEGVLPNEVLATRMKPYYYSPDTVFLHEEWIYRDLVENNMFHQMANAYLIECSKTGIFSNMSFFTGTMDRAKKDALMTVVYDDCVVKKIALYPQGKKRIREIYKNLQKLKSLGIAVVDAKILGDSLVMPYIEAPTAQSYLQDLFLKDRENFLIMFDKLIENVKKSAVEGKVFYDLVPLNAFVIDGDFVYFDQEFFLSDFPVEVVMARNVFTFYSQQLELEKELASDVLLERYGLLENRSEYGKKDLSFLQDLWNDSILGKHNALHQRNDALMMKNRERMNYSADTYKRLFESELFEKDDKDLIVFGTGRFAEQFLKEYEVGDSIRCFVDNDSARWGMKLHGEEIKAPDILKELPAGTYKVMICIKRFEPIICQLEEMGIKDYKVYRP